jgi:hypothetical protein
MCSLLRMVSAGSAMIATWSWHCDVNAADVKAHLAEDAVHGETGTENADQERSRGARGQQPWSVGRRSMEVRR